MKLVAAAVIFMWWLALWGLSDIMTEGWTRAERTRFYIGMLFVVTLVVCFFPEIMDRL